MALSVHLTPNRFQRRLLESIAARNGTCPGRFFVTSERIAQEGLAGFSTSDGE